MTSGKGLKSEKGRGGGGERNLRLTIYNFGLKLPLFHKNGLGDEKSLLFKVILVRLLTS